MNRQTTACCDQGNCLTTWFVRTCVLAVVLVWSGSGAFLSADENQPVGPNTNASASVRPDANEKAPVTIFTPSAEQLKTTKLNATDAVLEGDGTCVEFHAHGRNYAWPGPIWSGHWNLQGYSHVLVDLENLEEKDVRFDVRIDDAGTKQNNASWFHETFTAPAKKRGTFAVPLTTFFPEQLQGKVVGMRGLPGGFKMGLKSLDWQNVLDVYLYVGGNYKPAKFRLYSVTIVANGNQVEMPDWMKLPPEEFFPMIDCYGQFKYEDWPGKIHSDADFAERIQAETADLAANPRPNDWDRYGGWLNGPQRQATGRFRVEKVDGKWWFVTPEGHLFWSHGTDCVSMSNGTGPISLREHYFEGLPTETPFYGTGFSALGFYADKGKFRTYNWQQANLKRKYGDDFANLYAKLVHQRLASWAMNTIGNWSLDSIYQMEQTPYVVTLNARGRNIEGSEGYWGKFPDPFSEEFRKSIEDSVKQKQTALKSPFCLGAFTNNELSWGDQTSLSRAALASPANQPAKLAFLQYLQGKYGTIERLNEAWKTSYADWNALLQGSEVPKNPELTPDLEAFYTCIAEKYFAVIHEVLNAKVPGTLDLGCRFAWTCELAVRAMAKYVDVMSYNRYEENLTQFRLPQGLDMPVIIGEFHFGALDRGVFHTGLRGAKDQQERAQKYYGYVRSAVEHPLIVGTHWFQYGAQPTTGRFDGENYQIGLVDIADTPYIETIQKVREIGRSMYELRSKSVESQR